METSRAPKASLQPVNLMGIRDPDDPPLAAVHVGVIVHHQLHGLRFQCGVLIWGPRCTGYKTRTGNWTTWRQVGAVLEAHELIHVQALIQQADLWGSQISKTASSSNTGSAPELNDAS